MNMMDKVIFLDRDGTINEEVHYLHRPEDMVLYPGVGEALGLLNRAGFKLVVVTNQAGVARGYYTEEDVKKLHEYMKRELEAQGAHIDHFFYCPHHPEAGIGDYRRECSCRKPAPGMLQAAEAYYEVDKAHSYMIGDKLADVEAGNNYGIPSVLVGTGYGAAIHGELTEKGGRLPYDCYAESLAEAVDWIMEREQETEDMEPYKFLDELVERYPELAAVKAAVGEAYEVLEHCYATGGKLLVAGNGGSCADAEHIVGELMKGFIKRREVSEEFRERLEDIDREEGGELARKLQGALPAIALNGHPGLSTAFLNDVDGDLIYAQQTFGYGEAGDVLLGISTSGNAVNIMHAVTVARAKGMKVIGLTGKTGGRLGMAADVAIIVPENETYKIQEYHLPIYHTLCLMLEERFF